MDYLIKFLIFLPVGYAIHWFFSLPQMKQYRGPVVIVFLIGFLIYIFTIGSNMAGHTLYEVMVEGNAGAKPGANVQRAQTFAVEHSGVKHWISLAACDKDRKTQEATLYIKLLGPEQQVLFDKLVQCTKSKESRTAGADEHFVPENIGNYTLIVAPVSPNVDKIHIYISDPQKKDGKRLEGY